MARLTREEAERLLAGLRVKRDAAIDAGDVDEMQALDERIARLEANLNRGRTPGPHQEKGEGGMGPMKVVLLVLGLLVGFGFCATLLETETNSASTPATPADSAEAARIAALTARSDSIAARRQAERDSVEAIYGEEITNEFAVRRSVERTIKLLARNPRSVDVESCSEVYRDEGRQTYWTRCSYYATNGFGAEIREVMQLSLRKTDGNIVALPLE